MTFSCVFLCLFTWCLWTHVHAMGCCVKLENFALVGFSPSMIWVPRDWTLLVKLSTKYSTCWTISLALHHSFMHMHSELLTQSSASTAYFFLISLLLLSCSFCAVPIAHMIENMYFLRLLVWLMLADMVISSSFHSSEDDIIVFFSVAEKILHWVESMSTFSFITLPHTSIYLWYF